MLPRGKHTQQWERLAPVDCPAIPSNIEERYSSQPGGIWGATSCFPVSSSPSAWGHFCYTHGERWGPSFSRHPSLPCSASLGQCRSLIADIKPELLGWQAFPHLSSYAISLASVQQASGPLSCSGPPSFCAAV